MASFATPDFNSEVEDLRWHSADPNTFAVKLADGRIIEYNVSTGSQTRVATLSDIMSSKSNIDSALREITILQ